MSGKKKFTLEDVRETYKKKDAWWTVLLVDPIASRLILPTANYTNITPNQLSLFSFANFKIILAFFEIGFSQRIG